ncbi:dihydroxyacetone kinase phosphoryl donor subunit DhaM [Clostridium sp.]|jgi:PTS hybrid protein|uniref:dihydroxyacetone kinase phosphoryl donor subunit DhaM n=1 Tax=Clostridium sp. TaxID=1506 RepID=UPI003EEB3374
MVGMVLVSHSLKVAEGVKEIAIQMAEGVSIAAAGGTEDGRIGTDINKIINAIKEVYSEDGVIVIFDLGSAFMNSDMATESLPLYMKGKVEILDTAFVEGSVVAAVECSMNKDINDIKDALKPMCLNKIR